jgi:hypothetical protein
VDIKPKAPERGQLRESKMYKRVTSGITSKHNQTDNACILLECPSDARFVFLAIGAERLASLANSLYYSTTLAIKGGVYDGFRERDAIVNMSTWKALRNMGL